MPSFRQREKKREAEDAAAFAALPPGPLTIKLRGLTEADLPCVARLHRRRLPMSYSDEYFASALRSAQWSKVACWQSRIVGAVICREDGDAIHIRSLVTAVQRRGIGCKLLKSIFVQARECGICKSRLNVHVRNDAAIAFYKTLGYFVLETRVEYYHRSRDKIEAPPDAYLMQIDLEEMAFVGPPDDGDASQNG